MCSQDGRPETKTWPQGHHSSMSSRQNGECCGVAGWCRFHADVLCGQSLIINSGHHARKIKQKLTLKLKLNTSQQDNLLYPTVATPGSSTSTWYVFLSERKSSAIGFHSPPSLWSAYSKHYPRSDTAGWAAELRRPRYLLVLSAIWKPTGCRTFQQVWFPVDFWETFWWKFSRIQSFWNDEF